MDLRRQYNFHMGKISPSIDELPGDLSCLAQVIEDNAPGYGVPVVVGWSMAFRGIKVHWCNLRRHDKALEYAMKKSLVDEKDDLQMSIMELPSECLKMLASEADVAAPGIGLHITLRVAWAFRESDTHLHNLDRILSRYRNEWIIDRYSDGDVAAWELAVATGLSSRRVEEILGTGGAPKTNTRQVDIFTIFKPMAFT